MLVCDKQIILMKLALVESITYGRVSKKGGRDRIKREGGDFKLRLVGGCDYRDAGLETKPIPEHHEWSLNVFVFIRMTRVEDIPP